jgi:YesN/AraC family two-component response regulator
LKIFPEELQFDKLINWKSIGYEMVGKANDGKEKKAQKVEYHETQLR